jgi:hypothetical protein
VALTYPLENLLPPNILQPAIQVPHLLHNILDLALIRTLDLACLADREVQLELDAARRLSVRQPAAVGRGARRREAEPVLARVCGREGEAALGGAALRDDAVVVIKDLLDGYEDA